MIIQKGQKFTLKKNASKEEIWAAIEQSIPSRLKKIINKEESELIYPYDGFKEYIIRAKDKTDIAYASISDSYEDKNDWSLYQEN